MMSGAGDMMPRVHTLNDDEEAAFAMFLQENEQQQQQQTSSVVGASNTVGQHQLHGHNTGSPTSQQAAQMQPPSHH